MAVADGEELDLSVRDHIAKDFGSNPNSFHQITGINKVMKNPFTKHPEEIGETYFQHLWFAGRIAWVAFWVSVTALVHALLPFLFKETASGMLKCLNDGINKREL